MNNNKHCFVREGVMCLADVFIVESIIYCVILLLHKYILYYYHD